MGNRTFREIQLIVKKARTSADLSRFCKEHDISRRQLDKWMERHRKNNDSQSSLAPERDRFISAGNQTQSDFYRENIEHFSSYSTPGYDDY